MFFSSWSRGCSEMKHRMEEYSDNTQGITGWLERHGAETGSKAKYIVPGTAWRYKCRHGFDLPPDGTGNPDQILACEGSRKVDFSVITKQCRRELRKSKF